MNFAEMLEASRFNPRLWSNSELKKIADQVLPGQRIINVAGWKDLDKQGRHYRDYFREPQCYHISNYAGDIKRGGVGGPNLTIDLSQELPCELESMYDVAFNHTVLEHLEDPRLAFLQIAKLSKDIVISVVPFKQKLHFEPGAFDDFFRLSPFAMRAFHKEAGLTVLYESYTPPPALDVYLLYVGSRKPEKHKNFPRAAIDLNRLNFEIGNNKASSLAQNICFRFVGKYFPRLIR